MGVLLLAIFLPLAAGALLPLLRRLPRRAQLAYVTAVLAAEAVLTVALACMDEVSVTLLRITPELVVAFRTDGVARVFSLIGALLWLPVGVYSFKYLTHEANENRFLSFYLLVLGALLGMDYASNLVSMYFFYELVTLTALPLVLHSGTKESIRAALKYLFYSIAGAFLALLGIFCVSRFTTLDFVPGGTLAGAVPESYLPLVRTLVFCAVLGFGAKAGLYPLHGWLPAAHPVAPGPASAVLSAVIAKSGVLGILRFIYFVVGPDFLRGTWVQIAWLALGMATILMGSMMAWREKLFKRRLAYSTVSQISYILCGLFLLTEAGVQGALLHTVFHAVAKTGLFLTAGAVIFYTGKTRVDELRGVGRQLPLTMSAYTLVALSLIGIPPLAGFVSKWYLATASLDTGLAVVSWLYPVVLLISALLTAAYLLPITLDGFFPGRDAPVLERTPESPLMTVPLLVLGAASLLLGLGGGWLAQALAGIAAALA